MALSKKYEIMRALQEANYITLPNDKIQFIEENKWVQIYNI